MIKYRIKYHINIKISYINIIKDQISYEVHNRKFAHKFTQQISQLRKYWKVSSHL